MAHSLWTPIRLRLLQGGFHKNLSHCTKFMYHARMRHSDHGVAYFLGGRHSKVELLYINYF